MAIHYLPPLDQPEMQAVFVGDLDPGNAQQMDAGAGVVIAPV